MHKPAVLFPFVMVLLCCPHPYLFSTSVQSPHDTGSTLEALSGCNTVVHGTEPIASRTPTKELVGRMIKAHMAEFDIPGVQIAVASHGQLVMSAAYGWSDMEKHIPVTSNTRFRIGSVSKALTAGALGVLIGDGKLDLDHTVDLYVPAFPQKKWKFTIGQLAAHTAGIRHYASAEEASSTVHYASVTASLAQFSNDALLFEPGTDEAYSSFGYTLLSAVIESASGRGYPDFMNERVFKTLGMDHTSMDVADADIPERSTFYVIDENDKRVVAPFVDHSGKWAAGGIISTAEDLVRFGLGFTSGQLFEKHIADRFQEPARLKDGRETTWGIGWEIVHDAAMRKVVSMDGSLPSARSVLLLYPEQELVVAITMNTGSSIFFNRQEAMMLADLFLDPRGDEPSREEVEKAVGRYTYSTVMEDEAIDGVIEIIEKDGQLQGTMTIPNGFFKERSIAVPVVKVFGNTVTMIGMPGNWIAMSFTREEGAMQGSWRFGPIRGEMKGQRTP